MKIDTFNLDLFSSRNYSETSRQQVTQEFRFLDLMDQKSNKTKTQNMGQEQTQQQTFRETSQKTAEQLFDMSGLKFTPVLVDGQLDPKLSSFLAMSSKQTDQFMVISSEQTNQFMAEMDKAELMMDAIMDDFNRLNMTQQFIGGNVYLNRMGSLDSNFSSRNSNQWGSQLSAYEYSESTTYTYSESEQTRFSATGVVNTTDGNEINFSFEMEMARSFLREESFAYTQKGYALIDPLIVNAGVTTPKFSEVSFAFDLDLDGNPEDIQAPAWGTGFLALDKNKDGIINDGNELFGPSTGDGFAELAAYDLDNNSWIDENDAVFDELSLYGMDENGEMQLTLIKDAGMGAIYLAGVDTQFDVKNKDNELLARIKKSSIALNEDGSVSSVQEADWTA